MDQGTNFNTFKALELTKFAKVSCYTVQMYSGILHMVECSVRSFMRYELCGFILYRNGHLKQMSGPPTGYQHTSVLLDFLLYAFGTSL